MQVELTCPSGLHHLNANSTCRLLVKQFAEDDPQVNNIWGIKYSLRNSEHESSFVTSRFAHVVSMVLLEASEINSLHMSINMVFDCLLHAWMCTHRRKTQASPFVTLDYGDLNGIDWLPALCWIDGKGGSQVWREGIHQWSAVDATANWYREKQVTFIRAS